MSTVQSRNSFSQFAETETDQHELLCSTPFAHYADRKTQRLYEYTDTLVQGIFDNCFIPYGSVRCEEVFKLKFACVISNESIKVRSINFIDNNADFCVIASIRAWGIGDPSTCKIFTAIWHGLMPGFYAPIKVESIICFYAEHLTAEDNELVKNMCKLANKHYGLVGKKEGYSSHELKKL